MKTFRIILLFLIILVAGCTTKQSEPVQEDDVLAQYCVDTIMKKEYIDEWYNTNYPYSYTRCYYDTDIYDAYDGFEMYNINIYLPSRMDSYFCTITYMYESVSDAGTTHLVPKVSEFTYTRIYTNHK